MNKLVCCATPGKRGSIHRKPTNIPWSWCPTKFFRIRSEWKRISVELIFSHSILGLPTPIESTSTTRCAPRHFPIIYSAVSRSPMMLCFLTSTSILDEGQVTGRGHDEAKSWFREKRKWSPSRKSRNTWQISRYFAQISHFENHISPWKNNIFWCGFFSWQGMVMNRSKMSSTPTS